MSVPITELKTAQTSILSIFNDSPVNMHRKLDFKATFLDIHLNMNREAIDEALTAMVNDGVIEYEDKALAGYPKIKLTEFGRLVVRKMFDSTTTDDGIATTLAAGYKI